MAPRTTAADRYRRILAMVPWIAQHAAPTITEVAMHFGITEKQLQDDLDVVLMVGLPPYLPGDFIDVSYESGHIDLRLGDLFTRPLQLNATEALTILTSSAALRAAEADENGPINRALAKLQVALGVPDGSIEVTLGQADSAVLETLRVAVASAQLVDIDYYSVASDTSSTRTIEPTRLYATQGNFYVAGKCHQAGGDRVFRVDRIRSATLLDTTFERPEVVPDAVVFSANPAMDRVAFDLESTTRIPWSVARPESTVDLGNGRRRVVYAVSGPVILGRLALELDEGATVVAPSELGDTYLNVLGPDEVAAARAAIAARILSRYS